MKTHINKGNGGIYPWVVVGLLWFVALLNYMDRQMLSTMKVSMMVDIEELISAENFGRLMAIFLWVYALMSPVAGLIADRVNRKWLIVGSLAVWSSVTLAMGFVDNYNHLYILRAIMGVSEALYIPAGLALIADYHRGHTRSLAIGIHMTGLYAGQALGGFGATIADRLSWHHTFFYFGLVGIAYSVILILFLRENKQVRSLAKGENKGWSSVSIKKSLGLLLGTISFWIILFYFAAPSFPGWAIKNWLPTLFSESLHIDMAKAGPMATITIASSSFIGVICGGIIADRWIGRNLRGRILTGAIGLTLTIPSLFFIGFGQSLPTVIGGALFFGVGYGMFDANNMPILAQFVSPRNRAAGYGLMNLTGVLAGALITEILGRSSDAGKLGRDMTFLAIPVAIAVILMISTLKPEVIDKEED